MKKSIVVWRRVISPVINQHISNEISNTLFRGVTNQPAACLMVTAMIGQEHRK